MQKKECVKKKGTDNADRRDNRKRTEIENEGKRKKKEEQEKKKKTTKTKKNKKKKVDGNAEEGVCEKEGNRQC